uniref:Uncharacterized protein n=1 Tax=Rhizophora mucronata TaxID=61149 RepID=A0A2P2PIW8_RHIMU
MEKYDYAQVKYRYTMSLTTRRRLCFFIEIVISIHLHLRYGNWEEVDCLELLCTVMCPFCSSSVVLGLAEQYSD